MDELARDGITFRGKHYGVVFFGGGDYKWLCEMCGHGGPNCKFPCILCFICSSVWKLEHEKVKHDACTSLQ